MFGGAVSFVALSSFGVSWDSYYGFPVFEFTESVFSGAYWAVFFVSVFFVYLRSL